jgi:hypothetical protein
VTESSRPVGSLRPDSGLYPVGIDNPFNALDFRQFSLILNPQAGCLASTIYRKMNRIFGVIGGVILGSIICIIIRIIFDLSLTAMPIHTLLLQLSPGILIGAALGFRYSESFEKFFDFLTNF